ncbi:MAG: DUF4242 domain-containing protein [Gammaproteobacteria bacterium]|nr:DUF4242 domain-containing protein [Gammaproteobacteria bacterium]NIM74859.1 DUF4242 domain-containing protein [Gammaproteobacteria bacterium]NIN39451.1 DUF4242 domain-containing protein [Gammaproteobacteria bacterium]NIO26777.1 DUF4242 domain-containing protein [Gammaproteobacteria bacterium]NIO67333.1 DUF4242 domain-containing protein [Gammaproteobacteria bacterium]
MPRFIIERAIPEIGSADHEALRAASAKSNGVLEAMQTEGKRIYWEQSYVTDDKTFCIYRSDSEALISEHSERSGFPATIITEVREVIGPMTAESA